jgi:DNA polymerase I
MHERLFAILIRNPFERLPFILASDGSRCYLIDDVAIFRAYRTIVAYGFEEAIDEIRSRKADITSTIVDVATMKKLCVGRPKRDFKNDLPWKLRNIIGTNAPPSALSWVKNIYEMKNLRPQHSENFLERLAELLDGFILSYDKMVAELRGKNEFERFFTIEAPIYNIFLKAQLIGISVSQVRIRERLKELKREYYSSLKRLEFDYGFNTNEIRRSLGWESISEYCELSSFKEEFDYRFWDTVELLKDHCDFLTLLDQARMSDRDYTELLKYKLDKYHRIYPEFDVMGSVTGRVLVTKPGIQYLKKRNRDIFAPRKGMRFIYADFDQFEPGIMASLAGSEKLIELYNKKDVYEELSGLLFGGPEKRKIAKVLFLSFMYGMSKGNIGKLMQQIGDEKAMEKGLKFFELFKDLDEWKSTIVSGAERSGFISTYLGNRRYVRRKGRCNYDEIRWIPNQLIQGTASYIFKRSIIDLCDAQDAANILIPMHDAVLIETPVNKEIEMRNMVKAIFEKNFHEVCPEIRAGLSFEEFAT